MNPDRPLAGKLVVVACSELKQEDLRFRLQELGAEVIVFPAIRIRALGNTPAAQQAISKLDKYDWVIFTSGNAVVHFAPLLEIFGRSLPASVRVCAIGPATAEAARAVGFKVHLVPGDYIAEGIVEALSQDQQLAGTRILFPRAREAREVIPSALRDSGAHVDVLPVYETVVGEAPDTVLHAVRSGAADLLVFTSSSNVTNFVSILGDDDGRNALASTVVAVLGPVTATTAACYGKQPEIVPPENTIASLVSAIAAYRRQ